MDTQRGADFHKRALLRRGLDFLCACWYLPANLRNSCPRRGLGSSAPAENAPVLCQPPSVEAQGSTIHQRLGQNPGCNVSFFPEARTTCVPGCLASQHRTRLKNKGMSERGPGSSPSLACVVLITVRGRTWNSIQPAFTPWRVPWGDPVPQKEWERRVWREFDLCHDQWMGPFGHGILHCCTCGVQGSKQRPLGSCCCCDHWACEARVEAPACLAGSFPMCPCHPEVSIHPGRDFSWLRHYWD
eukprot:4056994-Amphidinium_carterae.1